MKVLFRTDASVQIGSGHVMRCLTLATALAPYADCEFICRAESGHLADVIRQQGFNVQLLAADTALQQQQDARATIETINHHYELLIIDHYQLAAEYEAQLRPHSKHIMVIDDLANRQHDCDILLDQNLFPDTAQRYQHYVPTHCQQLLGPKYALLRDEFYQAATAITEKNHLLVFFGGADADNLTGQTLLALQQFKFSALTVDIVIGASNPAKEQIAQLCQQLPGTRLHIQCHYMAELMQQARLMIGAGGSTHWERCYSGLPALIVTVADNQRATTRYLAKLGACVWLGDTADITPALLAKQISVYLAQPEKLNNMAIQAKNIIPAQAGTRLVVDTLRAICRN